MADFNIRTDAVDVEQIMRQIRARIQAKRGVDYTEEQIQELANVKLERFLDPKGVRSDLVEQFKRARGPLEPFEPQQYSVDANDLYGSSRAPVRLLRQIFRPILKMLLNANRLVQVLHQQSVLNRAFEEQLRLIQQQRHEVDGLYYELVHNLVLELTRVGIENRNLKMRVESLSSRMDFDERRARALETVVQYRPGTGPSREAPPPRSRPDDRAAAQAQPAGPVPATAPPPQTPSGSVEAGAGEQPGETSTARRRRRRRRGRRGGRGRAGVDAVAAGEPGTEIVSSADSATPPHGDPTADAALDNAFDNDDEGPEAGADEDDSGGDGPDPAAQ